MILVRLRQPPELRPLLGRLVGVALFCTFACGLLEGAPANDNFSAATLLTGTNIALTGSNIQATKEISEPNHGANSGGRSVWWKWAAPSSGSVVMQTTGSYAVTSDGVTNALDTLLAAYRGSSLGDLNLIAGNDDSGKAKTSLIAFNVVAGMTYYIAVDGFNGASGIVQLALAFRPTGLPAVVNDDFKNRIPLAGSSVSVTNANYNATKEQGEPNHAKELGGASVWWSWTAPIKGKVSISTQASPFDTLLAVYTGSVLTNLTLIKGNDDVLPEEDATSALTFEAEANTTYQIAVDGFNGEMGEIRLQIAMDDVVWWRMPQRLASGFRISLGGVPGRQYRVEASEDLVHWETVGGLPTPAGSWDFDVPWPLTSRARFFRAEEAK